MNEKILKLSLNWFDLYFSDADVIKSSDGKYIFIKNSKNKSALLIIEVYNPITMYRYQIYDDYIEVFDIISEDEFKEVLIKWIEKTYNMVTHELMVIPRHIN